MPGVSSLSEEERKLAPDPALGVQHGVILLQEILRDEAMGFGRFSYHVRAKVLSNEGRGLGDITLPANARALRLRKWWGRTILPDGSVLELGKEDLKEQETLRAGGYREKVLKAALPGIVPDCVVDYGFVYDTDGVDWWASVPLQESWPIQRLKYQWLPADSLISQYFIRRRTDLNLEVTREKEYLYIEGKDLPLVVEEPYMPPFDLVRSNLTLYYMWPGNSTDPNAFWNEVAKEEEKEITEFFRKDELFKQALEAMQIPADLPLEEKLQLAYDWIAANIKNRGLMTSEEDATADSLEEKERKEERHKAYVHHRQWGTVADILSRREGMNTYIDYLFVGFARALGAEAHVVRAPVRIANFWDTGLLSKYQIPYSLVAVRDKGEPLDKLRYVDPGSGLPYGTIPWRVTPTKALLASPRGAREVMLPHSDARVNVLATRARISFRKEDGAAHVVWSAMGGGQSGSDERFDLRTADPEQRRKRIDALCGASGDFEVSRAEAPGLEDLNSGYALECEGDLLNTGLDPTASEYSFPIAGEWIPGLPQFPSPERVHPVVFSFPWTDLTTLEIAAPEGLTLSGAPPPVLVDSPFGRYMLKVSAAGGGYRVERRFLIHALVIKPESYSELRGFLEKVSRADRARLQFRRAGGPS